MKLVPLPFTHVAPALLLYSQVAPASSPVTLTAPTLVMPSVALVPVSSLPMSAGAAGAVLSATPAWVELRLTLVTAWVCVFSTVASSATAVPDASAVLTLPWATV